MTVTGDDVNMAMQRYMAKNPTGPLNENWQKDVANAAERYARVRQKVMEEDGIYLTCEQCGKHIYESLATDLEHKAYHIEHAPDTPFILKFEGGKGTQIIRNAVRAGGLEKLAGKTMDLEAKLD